MSQRILEFAERTIEVWYGTASGCERAKSATYAMKRDRARKIVRELNLYPTPYWSRFCNFCRPFYGLLLPKSSVTQHSSAGLFSNVRGGDVGLAIAALMVFSAAADAQIRVTVDRNTGVAATKEFKFKTVPSPAKDDAAAKASVTLLVGESDPSGGDLAVLTDGLLPSKAEEPKPNFYFASGSGGGRVRMDFGGVIEIRQVNSYSWHTGAGAPQVYRLYASDGAEIGFNSEPDANTDPMGCGWKLITTVDTRKSRDGGQVGVSVTDVHGILGKYRYLLFGFVATETDDDAGNTFYSEIDVVTKKH